MTQANLDRAEDTSAEGTTSYGGGTLTLLVVASMIGSGVFTTSGFTLAAVGSPARVLLCWLMGGVIATCGAVAYGQLSRLIPQNGGEYLYLSRHVHPAAGFLAGWTSLTAGFSGAIALAAVTLERYAIPIEMRPSWLPPDVIAIATIGLVFLAHWLQAGVGKLAQNSIVLIKLVALIGFVLVAAWQIPTHQWHDSPLPDAVVAGPDLWNAVASSLVWVSFSYLGFNAAIYVASESPSASRSVPAALVRGTLLVTLLYLLLNAVVVMAVPAEDLANQEAVAAIAAAALGGQQLEVLIRVAVCLGLLTSVSGMIMTGPRVYSKMADDGVFPSFFRVDNGGIPRSIALQAAISIGLILIQRLLIQRGWLSSPLLGLLIYLSTTLSLSSACCVGTLFLPSVRRDRPQQLGGVVAAGLYLASVVLSIGIMVAGDGGRYHVTGTIVTVVTGGIAWFVLRLGPPADRSDS